MRNKFFITCLCLFTISILCVGCQKKEDKLDSNAYNGVFSGDKNNSNTNYSNTKLSWGILRKPNHDLPDADPGSPELIAKYGGVYLGDTTKDDIYLTFDMGYENGYTSKILDSLKANNVKVVFFITAHYLKESEDLVRRIVNEGHEVGNHTQNHPSLPDLNDEKLNEEVVGLNTMFYDKFGKNMKFFRAPQGLYSERTLSMTQELGYINMFWSFGYNDWNRDVIRGPNYTNEIVMKNLHKGAILLLHSVSKDNADALDMIIKGAKKNGYVFGTPDYFLKPGQD